MKRKNSTPHGRPRPAQRRRATVSIGSYLEAEALEARLTPAVDLSLIGPGLAGPAFAALQQAVDAQVLNRPVFLLGDQLANKPAGDVLIQLRDKLQGLTIGKVVSGVDGVKDALAAKLGTMLVGGRAGITAQAIAGAEAGSTLFQLVVGATNDYKGTSGLDLIVDPRTGIDIADSKTTFSIQGVAAQPGGPKDNASLLDTQVRWSMRLTFGVDGKGFFLQTSDPAELQIGVGAKLRDNVEVFGKLGILPATFTNKAVEGQTPLGTTQFDGIYSIDVVGPINTDAGESSKLRADEFSSVAATGRLGGRDANNNPTPNPALSTFSLTANGSFLPKVLDPSQLDANLGSFFNLDFATELSYSVSYAAADPAATNFGAGTEVLFTALRMDISPFYTDFIQPIVVKLQQFLQPFKQIIDVLEAPIPVIGEYLAKIESRGAKPPTVRKLLVSYMETTGKGDKAKIFDTSLTLMAKILGFNSGGLSRDKVGKAVEDLGTYAAKAEAAYTAAEQRQRPGRPVLDRLKDNAAAGASAKSFMTDFGGSFSFPFLQDPMQVFRLILGDPNVTLFQFDTSFSAGLELSKFIPLFYGLGLKVGGGINVSLNIGAGFDSKGLAEQLGQFDLANLTSLKDFKFEDFGKGLLKGFYFDDHNPIDPATGLTTAPDNSSADGNEAELSFTIKVGPGIGVDLGVFQAVLAVTGNVTATIGIDLNDLREPNLDGNNYDGRVRLDEFAKEFDYHPLAMVNAKGNLKGGLEFSVLVRAGVPPAMLTLVDEHYTLFEATILDFNIYTWDDSKIWDGIDKPKTPDIAYQNSGVLNLRTDAPDNTFYGEGASKNDLVQAFVLGRSANGIGYDVEVRRNYGVYRKLFTNVTGITGAGGSGDDQLSVFVSETDQTTGEALTFDGPIHLTGGAGRDRLIVRGNYAGASLDGGDEDDYLSGGNGIDVIDGGAGNDTIEGNGGNDTLRGGDGNDQINGGAGADALSGEGGNDQIDGGAGADTLEGGAGDDNFLWRVDQGSDTIVGGGSSAYDPATLSGGDRLTIIGGETAIPSATDLGSGASVGRNDSIVINAGRVLSATDGTSLTYGGIAIINAALGAGADLVTINDLSNSSVRAVNLDLKAPASGGNATLGDTVIVNLGTGDDKFSVTAARATVLNNDSVPNAANTNRDGPIDLLQLSLDGGITLQIQNSNRSTDRLVVRGNDGRDTLGIALGSYVEDGATKRLDPTTLIGITLDGGRGNDILTASGAGGVLLLGGDDNDKLTAGTGPDTLDGGAGDDTLIVRPTTQKAMGGAGTDILLYDDTARPASATATADYTVAAGSITAIWPGSVALVTNFADIEAMALNLGVLDAGRGNMLSVLASPRGGLEVNLSGRGDTVQFGSAVGGEGGTLASILGPVTVKGGGGSDRVTVDVSGATANANARLDGKVLTGLGGGGITLELDTKPETDAVEIRLGRGSDTITVTGTAAGKTTISGGEGADRLVARINGEASVLTGSPFAGLGFAVEELIFREAGSTQPTAWKLVNDQAYAGPIGNANPGFLLSSLGAGRVTFDGESGDTLSVVGNSANPQRATIQNGSIVVDQGTRVLDFAAGLVDNQLSLETKVDGLGAAAGDGNGRVASYPTAIGTDVYVTSSVDDSVTLFRYAYADRTLRLVQIVRNGDRAWGQAVTGLNGASGVAVSPDGKFVYVVSRDEPTNNLAIFVRDAASGQLRFVSTANVAGIGPVTNVLVNPSLPTALYVLGDSGINSYSRNVTTGLVTFAQQSKQRAAQAGMPSSFAIRADGKKLYANSNIPYDVLEGGWPSGRGLLSFEVAGTLIVSRQILPWDLTGVRNLTAGTGDLALVALASESQGDVLYQYSRSSESASVDLGIAGAKTIAVSPDIDSNGNRLIYLGTADGRVAVFQSNARFNRLTYLRTIAPEAGAPPTVGTWSLVLNQGGLARIVVGSDPSGEKDQIALSGLDPESTSEAIATTLVDGSSSGNLNLADLRGGTVVEVGAKKILYAFDPTSNSLAVFDVTSGMTLLQILRDGFNGIEGLGSIADLAADAAGVYVTSAVGNSVTLFEILSDGRLAIRQMLKLTDPSGAAVTPGLVRLSPEGKYAYVATGSRRYPMAWWVRNSNGELFGVNYMDSASSTPGGTSDLTSLRSASDIAFAAAGDPTLFVASAKSGLVSSWNYASGGLMEGSRYAIAAGDRPLALVASPDGRFLYVGDSDGSITILKRVALPGSATLNGLSFVAKVVDGVDGVSGLTGLSDLILSADGKSLIVAGWASDGLAAFTRDPATGLLAFQQVVRDGSGGVTDLTRPNALVLDGDRLYVTGSGAGAAAPGIAQLSITSYPINVATRGKATQSSDAAAGGEASQAIDGQAGTSSQTSGSAGEKSYWEVALDGSYALSSIVLRNRSDSGAARLSNFRVTVYDGGQAVASQDFFRGSGNVAAGGTATFTLPANVTGDRVRVELVDGLNNQGNSILSLAEVQVFAAARPIRRDVGFGSIGTVSLTTGIGDDTVVVRDTTANVTVNTGDGSDALTVAGVNSKATVAANLGSGADRLDILATGVGQLINASGGDGNDALNLFSAGNIANVNLNGDAGDDTIRVTLNSGSYQNVTVDGGAGADTLTLGRTSIGSDVTLRGGVDVDTFNVLGTGVSSQGTVRVDGGSPTPTGNAIDADTLVFDLQGGGSTSGQGTVRAAGAGVVSYADVTLRLANQNTPPPPAEQPPVAVLDPVNPIREGDGVTLVATRSAVPSGVTPTYRWDVNGDGSFFDAATSEPKLTLAWADLVRLGMADGGANSTWTVSVRVELPNGLSSVASTTLRITNVDPTLLSVSSDSPTTATRPVLAGSPVTVTATATDPAGTLDPLTYDFDFDGDGVFELSNTSGVASYAFAARPGGPATFDAVVRVRVRDDDGGTSQTLSTTVRVDNTPKVRALIGAATGLEGSAYTLNLAASGPKTDSIARWTIDWNDGTVETFIGTTTSARHTYADDGVYAITATVQDADGTATVAGPTVAVANVAPTARVTNAPPATINEGSTYTLALAATDPGADQVTSWTVNWGDGTSSVVAGSAPTAQHVYRQSRATPYTITATPTDEDSNPGNPYPGVTRTVTVLDVPPVVRLRGEAGTAEGAVYDLALDLLADPGDDVVSRLVIDWGDGTAPETYAATGTDPFVPPSRLYHTYADDAPGRTIRVSVTDGDGDHADVGKVLTAAADGTVAASPLVVSVANVAPTVRPAGPAQVDQGAAYTLTLPRPVDPGADTVTAYRVAWGDGTTTTATRPGDLTHVYAAGGVTRTITVELVDEDGTWSNAGSTTVQVRTVPPQVALSGAARVDEGSSYTLTLGAATRPGGGTPPTVTGYRIAWGDGTTETLPAGTSLARHTFAQGPFTQAIVVDLLTTEGEYLGAGRLVVTVDNVAPTFGLDTADRAVDRLAPVNLGSITIADPGTQDSHVVTIDWGDGTTSTVRRAAGESMTLALPAHAYAAIGTFTASVTVADDNGGTLVRSVRVAVRPAASDELRVEQVTVNNGSAQRSNIEQIAVRFNRDTNMAALIASGKIGQVVSLVGKANLKGAVSLGADRFRWNAATFTLTIDLTVDGFGGSRLTLLGDDLYDLQLDAAGVAGTLPGVTLKDNDGTPDGTYRVGFHRLLGDFDGDRQVSTADRTIFLAAYGTRSTDPKYDFACDLNGDGLINLADYSLFNQRMGRKI